MNRLERILNRTRMTVEQGCIEADLDPDLAVITNIETCSDCGTWLKHKDLKLDLDDNLICNVCWREYGP